jgi:TonB family protein
MHLTLLESDRSFLRTAECAFASIVAHAGLVWVVVGVTDGGTQLPITEREARVFFLLPPDRVDSRLRQTDIIKLGRLGTDLQNGKDLLRPGEGFEIHSPVEGARKGSKRSGAQGEVPFGPVPPPVLDTVFSVLEVDEGVERYEGSAAPAYPSDLLAVGTEGVVQAIYVVDSTGAVDTTTVEVIVSDDPRFTESVLTALAHMRFRPAKRAGKSVRQQVQQQFRFQIAPEPQVAHQAS